MELARRILKAKSSLTTAYAGWLRIDNCNGNFPALRCSISDRCLHHLQRRRGSKYWHQVDHDFLRFQD